MFFGDAISAFDKVGNQSTVADDKKALEPFANGMFQGLEESFKFGQVIRAGRSRQSKCESVADISTVKDKGCTANALGTAAVKESSTLKLVAAQDSLYR